MPIFSCRRCSRPVEVSPQLFGQGVRCPYCGGVFVAPTAIIESRPDRFIAGLQDPYLSQVELPNTFAQMLAAVFRRSGECRPIYYDNAAFALVLDGEDRAFWIGNLFVEFLRTKAEHWRRFFDDAWQVWSIVQAELPATAWGGKPSLKPFRDETHPLSYRVEPVSGTHLWAVAPPFDEGGGEIFDLAGAYRVWWSNQFNRPNVTNLCNIHRWFASGQVSVVGLEILSEMRRMWRQGMLHAASGDVRLANELARLGSGADVPPMVRWLLDRSEHGSESPEAIALGLRRLREQGHQ